MNGYDGYLISTSYFTGADESYNDATMGRIQLTSGEAIIKLLSSNKYNGTRKSVSRVYLVIPKSPQETIEISPLNCDTLIKTGIKLQ